MLNVLGGNKVYTVPEIDALLKKASGFQIVEKLPALASANERTVYYKRAKDTVKDLIGYRKADDPLGDDTTDLKDEPDDEYTVEVYVARPVLIPYIKGKDQTGTYVWFTTDSFSISDVLTDEEILEIWNKYDYRHTALYTTRHMALAEGQD